MRSIKAILPIFIIWLVAQLGNSQCNDPIPAAGLYCDTDHPTDPAPNICALDCLDGFTATMPSVLNMPQPDPLCNGGTPNNVSWFAFTAGSNYIDLSIIPSNCSSATDSMGNLTTIGVQAGIYADCSWDNSIVCATDGCLDMVAETLNLSSGDYVIGQTYYLFVDGCGGSVCDYTVVVNAGTQAFEMDEITTISNNLNFDAENDTLCQGGSIEFTLDSLNQEVNFDWSISPATSDYPSGQHPVIDTNTVSFTFSDTGLFTIYVYAYNFCDASETDSFQIYVQALEDEIFSDITICQECFPITLVTPGSGCLNTATGGNPTILTEDPNGDGVPGWQGTTPIFGPGLDTNFVTNNAGCQYMQIVNVLEQPLSPRSMVDYYFCLNDFPVVIDGYTFNSPGDDRNITLANAAASGCDSLTNITAHGIEIFGNTVIGNCENGSVELGFNITILNPIDYDMLTYTWQDASGMVITDNDGIDSVLTVTMAGQYSVRIEVTKDGTTCPLSFGPYPIDIDNLSPTTPTISYAPIEICMSDSIAQIYVANQNLGETYLWTITPNLPFNTGLTTDTIYVDITTADDFSFCVMAQNGCGASSEICDDVIVQDVPEAFFTIDEEICIDSTAIAVYSGADGSASSSNFIWNFDSGTVINGTDLSSGGPFELSYNAAGNYDITLILEESGCSSITETNTLTVSDPYTPPTILCTSNAGNVIFSWDGSTVTDIAYDIVSGQSDDVSIIGDSIVVDDLSSEEMVDIIITFNSDHICGPSEVTLSCSALPCPDIDFTIALGNQHQCIDEEMRNLELQINIAGDTTGTGTWISPFVIMDYVFDVIAAGDGAHPVTYEYVLGDCLYEVDTTIFLHSSPNIEVDIFNPLCEDDGNPTIDVSVDKPAKLFLNDSIINIGITELLPNTMYTLTAESMDGCSSEMAFMTEDYIVNEISIDGDTSIIQNENNTYTLIANPLDTATNLWTYNGDTICTDCTSTSIAPSESGILCVTIYYGASCNVASCISIEVTNRTEIYIPNIFSPNEDGINDLLSIQSNIENTNIDFYHIYDRWGNKVFSHENSTLQDDIIHWDGRFQNTMCLPGVYVYIIQYRDKEGNSVKKMGDVTLVN